MLNHSIILTTLITIVLVISGAGFETCTMDRLFSNQVNNVK